MLILFMIIFVLILTSCSKEPIKIGFIGDLSSKNSQLAIDARNALELGVQIVNEDGGINGRKLQLISKDDEENVEVALEKHKEFINEEVKFVLGHLNSDMSTAIIASASDDIMFVSPSMGSVDLVGKDDFFLRSGPVNNKQAEIFADYALTNNLEDIVIVCDLMNIVYTKTLADGVTSIMKDNQKPIKEIICYDVKNDELLDVVNRIIKTEAKNVFIIAPASDTAYLIQKLKQTIEDLGVFSVSWSMTKDLISNGGKNVEGTRFVGIYMPEEFTPEYIKFANKFNENYGYELSFIGVLSYDALNVLVEGLRHADKIQPEQVKESIISIGTFKGLYKDFEIDAYGDSNKEYMIYELNQGEFVPIRDWMD